jgi:hypothetical protein
MIALIINGILTTYMLNQAATTIIIINRISINSISTTYMINQAGTMIIIINRILRLGAMDLTRQSWK